jgi:hypothetical protein
MKYQHVLQKREMLAGPAGHASRFVFIAPCEMLDKRLSGSSIKPQASRDAQPVRKAL